MEHCVMQTPNDGIMVIEAWPTSKNHKRRWSTALKKELVMRLLRGEPVHGVSREMSVPEYKLERWRNSALVGIDMALRERDADSMQHCLEEAYRRINELSTEIERLRKGGRAKRAAPEPRSPRRPSGDTHTSLEPPAP